MSCFYPARCGGNRGRAFTLIEVLLATGITTALLLVVLFFYQQASNLRQQILTETEQLTTVRLVLDRLTRELRTARPHRALLLGLKGGSNSIEFVTTTVPTADSWRTDVLGRLLQSGSDLKWVTYDLAGPGDPSEATGVARSEGPVPEVPAAAPSGEEAEMLSPTEAPAATQITPSEPQRVWPASREMLTEGLRYLRFRYWDGSGWMDEWDYFELPVGVEITLGMRPFPADPAVEEYPYELFRRVVFLPAGEPWEVLPLDLEMLLGAAGEGAR